MRRGKSRPQQHAKLLSPYLENNLAMLQQSIKHRSDVVVRNFTDPVTNQITYSVVYIDSMVNLQTINDSIITRLSETTNNYNTSDPVKRYVSIQNSAAAAGQSEQIGEIEVMWDRLNRGYTIILLDGYSTAIATETSGGESRGVQEPTTQTVIRGPKDGFTESLMTNISLVRRRLKSDMLRVESKMVGTHTQTNISILYLEDIADSGVVEEVHKRLDRIETDSILDSGYLQEFIEDSTFTPFPTIFDTERPDSVVAGLLDGQVAIIVDGSPFVLLAPVTFVNFFQSSEDYYQRFYIASFLRMIRFGSFFISLLLPAFYLAVTTFHQEMLPSTLLISLLAQREGVPFPALVEAFLMELTFEVLREAGVRMPRAIGPAISIVGALVLGQAAVEAGLVSAAMVIIVSFTAIANFVIPSISMAIPTRLIRFVMMLLSGTLGLYGLMAGVMFLLIHLASLRSFGVPYLMPLAPIIWNNMKDVFIRVPLWAMRTRPLRMTRKNIIRQKKNQKPKPPG